MNDNVIVHYWWTVMQSQRLMELSGWFSEHSHLSAHRSRAHSSQTYNVNFLLGDKQAFHSVLPEISCREAWAAHASQISFWVGIDPWITKKLFPTNLIRHLWALLQIGPVYNIKMHLNILKETLLWPARWESHEKQASTTASELICQNVLSAGR